MKGRFGLLFSGQAQIRSQTIAEIKIHFSMERFVIRTARPATPDDTQSAAAAAAALLDLAGLPSSPSQAAGHTSDSVSMHVGPVDFGPRSPAQR